MMDTFHEALSAEEQGDPRFAYRVAFIRKTGNRASSADLAVEFVKPDSAEGREINSVLLKEVDKSRYTAKQIVNLMQDEGFPRFHQHTHTKLWQELDAKNPAKGFGKPGDYSNTWIWYEPWLTRVRTHCQEHAERYV
jgi:hypothetical protein